MCTRPEPAIRSNAAAQMSRQILRSSSVVELCAMGASGLADIPPCRPPSVTVADQTTIFLLGLVQSRPMDLKGVVEEFAGHIVSLLEAQATAKAQAEILGAFGMGAPRRPGRPPKTAAAIAPAATPVATKTRRKLPPQFCPVPYCRNVAAPIFGMVCSKHKDVPKKLIARYREERRSKKLGIKSAKKTPMKRSKRVAKKATRSTPTVAKKAPMAKKVQKRAAKKANPPVSKPAPSGQPATAATPV
jgi:hypothetical protein